MILYSPYNSACRRMIIIKYLFLNFDYFQTPRVFAVINLKYRERGHSIVKSVQNCRWNDRHGAAPCRLTTVQADQFLSFSLPQYHNLTGFYVQNFKGLATVKFLNFWTPENFAVIYLNFKRKGQTCGYFIKKMQMEWQLMKTLIRLLLEEQSDLGLHCLPRSICPKTLDHYGSFCS